MTPLDARAATADDSALCERLIEIVGSLAAETHGMRASASDITMDSQFERDLGFDSLTRAELLSRVEQAFSARLPVEAFAAAVTPGDVLRVLRHAAQTSATRTTEARCEAPTVAKAGIEEPRSARSLGEALQWLLHGHRVVRREGAHHVR